MYRIEIETWIGAPVGVCFDLAREVEAHVATSGPSGERVVGGRMAGLMELGEEVTWEGRHFGMRQRLTSRITAFEAGRYFRDEMVRGAFRSMVHDHYFVERDGGTVMRDVMVIAAPLGVVGWVAERVFLGAYMRRFLVRRARGLKKMAEGRAKGRGSEVDEIRP